VNQLIIHGYAVKTLESKETRASKEITVTHNSVFAAHRLQCRMTNRKNRHPAFCLYREIESGCNGCEATARLSNQEPGKIRKRSDSSLAYALFVNLRHVAGRNLPSA